MEKQIFTTLEVSDLETLITKCISSCLSKQTPKQEAALTNEPIYITRKEAAKILRIGITKLNELTKNGVLPSYRIGCNVRLIEHEVRSSLIKVNTGKGGDNV